jgi:hypothetical protein
MIRRAALALVLCGCSAGTPTPPPPPPDSPPPPLVPVGIDAYRMWDRLPYVRIGVRAYLQSTFDRRGGNEGADASHFLRQDADDFNVALDVAGPGVLYFARANHWHGSPWHYVVDGKDHVITETSTADPDHPTPSSVYLPETALPAGLTYTWSTTRGADLNWVPIPFTQSLTLGYGRTHYGTGYFIHHRFAEGAENLSRPLTAWDESPPDPEVVAWINAAGSDLAPSGPDVTVSQGTADIPASGSVTALDLTAAPATVRALRLRAPNASARSLSRALLRVTWDDRAAPSIEAPIGLFFGGGSLYDRSGTGDLVRARLASVQIANDQIALDFYYPMPFFRRAKVELAGAGDAIPGVSWEIVTEPFTGDPGHVAYFHATYRDHQTPVAGRDLVLLDTTEAEGGGDWCGHFAGTSFTFSDEAHLGTLEGDPRFFFDDSRSPQAQGTGTEEWGGGGDYWGGQTMTLPFAGHPTGAPSAMAAQNDDDKIESAYRFLVADIMPFGKNARIQLEHGGADDSVEHYRTVAYWYGRPGACLVRTDALHVGDPADESAHDYASPTAGPPETLVSRFELGVDTVNGVEVFPTVTDTGRRMTGDTELTLAIDPDNTGVLLRRLFDYGIADQRAEVSVAGVDPQSPFEPAGVWYAAGSNTVVYSNPPTELGAAAHDLETSNRRFREDEFLVPGRLTRGRAAIRIRLHFTPISRPIVPGAAPPDAAWSEYRYTAYSYLVPRGAP